LASAAAFMLFLSIELFFSGAFFSSFLTINGFYCSLTSLELAGLSGIFLGASAAAATLL
jgi:hypothetical protein